MENPVRHVLYLRQWEIGYPFGRHDLGSVLDTELSASQIPRKGPAAVRRLYLET